MGLVKRAGIDDSEPVDPKRFKQYVGQAASSPYCDHLREPDEHGLKGAKYMYIGHYGVAKLRYFSIPSAQ